MKTYEMDMCTGSLWKKILIFSIPLMFTNILQVLFNMADVAVVGQFAGSIALGAVGSTSILIILFTGILIGLSSGVNALTALYIGSKKDDDVRETVHSSAIICFSVGLFIMVLGILFADVILSLLKTKSELITDAILYLRIYLIGMPAMALFNFGSAVLNAAGDTKRPLYYLSFAGVINVLLNLFLVIVFQMGVAGVAIASIISQYICATLVITLLMRSTENYKLSFSHLKIEPSKMRRILQIGIPSAFQYALFAFANLFIQSSVNSFDHVIVEGNAAAANSDPLVFDMMSAFYTACASFIAQNLGAGKKERILKTLYICTLYSCIMGCLLGFGIYIFRYSFLSLFTNSTAVVEAGLQRITIMTLTYGITAFMDCPMAASRGMGKTVLPTIFVIIGSCLYRIVWVYTIFENYHTIPVLYLAFPSSWIITGIAEIIYFIVIYRRACRSLSLSHNV